MPSDWQISAILSGLPSRIRSQKSRRAIISAARRIRTSYPSGRTTERRFARAVSIRLCRNRSGVIEAGRSSSRRDSSSSWFTYSSQPPNALASLRAWPLITLPCTRETARADLKVSRSVNSTGKGALSSRLPTAVCFPGSSLSPPVSSRPDGAGNVGESADARVAATTSARSPGTITKSPSVNWFRKFETVIAAILTSLISRSRSSFFRCEPSSLRASTTSAMVGLPSSAISGRT